MSVYLFASYLFVYLFSINNNNNKSISSSNSSSSCCCSTSRCCSSPSLYHLGIKISSTSGDDGEGAFRFQRVSVLVQRYNAVLIRDSLLTARTDDLCPVLYIAVL